MTPANPPPVALAQLIPEPSNLWIEASPRWRGRDDVSWIDLRSRDLGGAASPRGPRWRLKLPPGTVYLPPVEEDQRQEARALAAWCASCGVDPVEHLVPGIGEALTPATESRIFDLLDLLLERAWDRLETIPPGSLLSWPLLPGLTDGEELVTSGLASLADIGPRAVVPVVPELTPAARRVLSERHGEEAFEAIFHRRESDPRAFAGRCVDHGVDYLPPRVIGTSGPSAGTGLERRIAAELGLIGDLRLETEGSAPRAQAFYRAANWFETTAHDVRAMLREGNLGVVPGIDREIGEVAEDLASGESRSGLLGRLALRYARRR